jgi:hypothetical protein
MGLLSKAAQRLGRSRLGALSRVGSLPFHETNNMPGLAAMTRRGVSPDIDPRLILGGGALAMAPTGAATAGALNAIRPYEEADDQRGAALYRAQRMNDEFQAGVDGMNQGGGGAPWNPGGGSGPSVPLPPVTDPRLRQAAIQEIISLGGASSPAQITEDDISRQALIIQQGLRFSGSGKEPLDAPRGPA